MANSQLTAYVNAQLDKGVARDAITQALIGAGWVQADVEAAVAEVVQQRGVAVAQPVASVNPVAQVQPTVTTYNPITTASPSAAASSPMSSPVTSSASVTPASFFATTPSITTVDTAATTPKRSLTWLFILVAVILAVGIAIAGAYVFLGGSGSGVASLTADPAMQQELTTTQQERDQLRGEVSTLSENVTALANELSIFQATTTPNVPLTIRGTLSTTTANAWILTTKNSIVLTITNMKEPGMLTTLTPLKGAEVELTATHAGGSPLLKVSKVNGSSVAPIPSAVGTSTIPAATTTQQVPPIR